MDFDYYNAKLKAKAALFPPWDSVTRRKHEIWIKTRTEIKNNPAFKQVSPFVKLDVTLHGLDMFWTRPTTVASVGRAKTPCSNHCVK